MALGDAAAVALAVKLRDAPVPACRLSGELLGAVFRGGRVDVAERDLFALAGSAWAAGVEVADPTGEVAASLLEVVDRAWLASAGPWPRLVARIEVAAGECVVPAGVAVRLIARAGVLGADGLALAERLGNAVVRGEAMRLSFADTVALLAVVRDDDLAGCSAMAVVCRELRPLLEAAVGLAP